MSEESSVSVPAVRVEWYQTETHVTVQLMAKKVDPEKSTIEISARLVRVDAKLQTGDEYKKDIDLSFEIIPEQSSFKIMSTKVELKLKKKDGIRWEKLEGAPGIVVQHPIAPVVLPSLTSSNGPPKYPSSSKKHKDWDSIKIEEDKDDDINQLFQKIYADGNDEIKKAMNKSFVESGGTVLSTNWKEISASKVNVQPPEGQEFRKWD
ncbi:protein SGT1 homolog [Cloeon dipterum]|uniref:protein SGT1 homolog n=1 Tax=Cloeon dipterum TaxID=197152 RepID=UPI00321F6B76